MALQVASLYGVLNLRDNMTPGLNTALGTARSFGSSIQSIGNSITGAGTRLTAFTAPVTAGLAAGIQSSNTFSRSMSNINSILGITGDEASTLRSQLLEYGGSTIAGPQAVADAYYQVVSGVADASTHMAILDAATQTSEAGQADLTATTSALISTMNSYGLSAEDAASVSDIFTRTVQTGVLTMDELASAFPQVTGLASSMGIGVEDLASQMSFLTTQGFTAANSATFLRGMMTTLLNPTTALGNTMSDLGYESGQAMVDALGLVGAYEAIREQGGGAFDGIITSQEALQGALALTGENATSFLNNFGTGVQGATENARTIQNETAGWEQFMSVIQQLSIMVGDTLAPVLLDLLNTHITPLVSGVTEWIAQNPQLAGTIGLVTGAFVTLGPILAIVGTAISAVGAAIAFIASPIGLAVAAVAGLGAIFIQQSGGMENAWANLTGVMTAIWDTVSPALTNLHTWFMDTGLPAIQEFITATVIPGITSFTDTIFQIWDDVSPTLTSLFDWFMTTGLPMIIDFLDVTVRPAIDLFTGTISGIWDTVSPYLTDLYNWFMDTGLPAIEEYITGPFSDAFTGLTDFISSIWDLVSPGLTLFSDSITGIFTTIIDTAITPLSNALGGAWDAFTSFTEWSGDALSSAGQFVDNINPFTSNNTQLGGNGQPIDGQRMAGGPVTAGRQYLVGEGGPELFTPSTSGNISSNRDTQAAMSGDGGININGPITVVANDPEDFMRQLQDRRRRRN